MMFWATFFVAFLYLIEFQYANDQVNTIEPLILLKSSLHKATPTQTETWRSLQGIDQVSQATNEAIEDMTYTRAVVAVRENQIIPISLPKGTELYSNFSLPFSTLLSVITVSVLEQLPTVILSTPLGDVDLPKDIVIPSNLRRISLLELINRVAPYNMGQIGLVNEMNVQARTAYLVVNKLVNNYIEGGWQKLLQDVSMSNSVLLDKDGIQAPLQDICTFIQWVLQGLKNTAVNVKNNYQHGNNYIFSWWINCDKTCLVSVLPNDALFSISPALRMYLIPSIGMSLVIANTLQKSHNTLTMQDLLDFDTELFNRIIRTVQTTRDNPVQQQQQSTENDDYDQYLEQFFNILRDCIVFCMDFFARLPHFVRIISWVIFLFLGHLVTAWLYHGIWWIVSTFVKRTHDPRPKRD